MTKSYIDSNSVIYDRRSALKGAVAIPLAALPLVAATASAAVEDETVRLWEVLQKHKPVCEELHNKFFEILDNLPPDYILDGKGGPLPPSKLDTHRKCEICARVTWGGGMTQDEREAKLKSELDAALRAREEAMVHTGYYDAERLWDEADKRVVDLEHAILDSTPTTPKGMAKKLKVVLDYAHNGQGPYMDAFLEELENFVRAI